MNAAHVHEALRIGNFRPFRRCLAATRSMHVKPSHDGITQLAKCNCGAVRPENINGPFIEVAPWRSSVGSAGTGDTTP